MIEPSNRDNSPNPNSSSPNPPDGKTASRATTPAETAAANLAEPLEELDSLRTRLAESQDRILRIQAELENYRKRARRELEDERRYAEIGLIADLLPVVDNMNRGIEAGEKKADPALLLSALKIMAQQFNDIFKKHHCTVINGTGEPFNPHLHEAILQQPNAEAPHHTVLNVIRMGLMLHDRVVRPAQVIVSGNPSSTASPQA
jgi:molecular chaperone GrpE